MRRPRFARTALALWCAVLCTGCTKIATQTGLPGQRHPYTQPGVLRVALLQDVKTLNPLLDSTTNDEFVDRLMFEPLITADSHGNPVPMLVREIPSRKNGGISADGLTITYHLRRDVRWTDGATLTSNDVRFSWQAIENPANDVVSRHGYDMIRAVDTPDPFTIVVHLRQPFAPFVNTFFAESDSPYEIVPAHVLSGYHDLNQVPFDTAPTVSDGPFRFVEWVHGDHILVTANDGFFLGPPKLRRIRAEAIPDETTAVQLMRTHAVDYVFEPSVNTYREASTIPDIRIVWNNVNGYEGIGFNLKHPPLDDERIRVAIASAIDKALIVRTLTSGQEKIATEDLPDWLWAFNPAALPPQYDPARARRLLAQAGYVIGSDGVARRNGIPLRLELASDTSMLTHRKLLVLVQSMLKNVGIELDLKLYPLPLLYAPAGMGGIMHRGLFDLISLPWYAGIDPDNSSQFMCQNIPPYGYNDTHYCTPAMQRAQATALASYDQQVRTQAYHEIEALLARDNPIVFLWWQRQEELLSPDFKGFAPNPVIESWNAWQWNI